MSVTRASLLDRLRHPAMATAETQKTILHTGCACADMREAADEIERLRAALKPFADAASHRDLEPAVADDRMPVKLGLMNGNVTQAVIEGVLRVKDFRAARDAYQQEAGGKE